MHNQNVQFNGQAMVAYNNTRIYRTVGSYSTIPFNTDGFYETRKELAPMTKDEIGRQDDSVRAIPCLVCAHCGKKVRFCPMCKGELKHLIERKENELKSEKGVKKMQCIKCHHVIASRFCMNCGMLYKDENMDVSMEMPPSEVGFVNVRMNAIIIDCSINE